MGSRLLRRPKRPLSLDLRVQDAKIRIQIAERQRTWFEIEIHKKFSPPRRA